ncbi:MAG: putative conserved small protein [Roseibaca calidilacus]|uniref:Putative conserved small protein n=1 Tax=Roseibaca calidilacus TaxID=1666912 RepID=A0A0P7YIN6_9RHOB|nr:DUF1127 domain-containing protein [Roseibaca calidilacus]KPP90485.1 MAG: putative conserved small protein [Roseibaca calidilacus]CUX83291.1 Uncharacterized conserved protein YjiS, DUF1127 family [Roseibaca calidilacus]
MTQTMNRSALDYLTAATTLPAVSVLALRVAVAVAKWSERRRTRADLAKLDVHGRRDIGLTEGQALRETQKPFWRA